jgi:hypothetical protein
VARDPGTRADIETLVQDVRSGLDEAAACVDAIAGGVDAALGHLPAGAAVAGRSAIADLRRRFAKVADHLREIVARGGDPAALRRTGAVWAVRVGGTASGVAAVSTPVISRVDDRWTGVAADAYRSSLPAQHAALLAIKSTGDDVDAALTDLANALTTFWAEISVALANLVAALFAAAVSATTAVGAPTAVAFALAALGIFAAAAKSTISALTAVATNAAARAAQLERRLSNDAAFPAGGWPRSTTDLTDASVVDGDDSDWHVR